jgi:hypothetical protein
VWSAVAREVVSPITPAGPDRETKLRRGENSLVERRLGMLLLMAIVALGLSGAVIWSMDLTTLRW